jgi:hypothetical protein
VWRDVQGPLPPFLEGASMLNSAAKRAGVPLLVLLACTTGPLLAQGQREAETRRIISSRGLKSPIEHCAQFLARSIHDEQDVSDPDYVIGEDVRRTLQGAEFQRVLEQIDSEPPIEIRCIGYNYIASDIVTLAFTKTTSQGPVLFKLSTYAYDGEEHLDRLQVTRDWPRLETLADSVERFPATVTLTLTPGDENEPAATQPSEQASTPAAPN